MLIKPHHSLSVDSVEAKKGLNISPLQSPFKAARAKSSICPNCMAIMHTQKRKKETAIWTCSGIKNARKLFHTKTSMGTIQMLFTITLSRQYRTKRLSWSKSIRGLKWCPLSLSKTQIKAYQGTGGSPDCDEWLKSQNSEFMLNLCS